MTHTAYWPRAFGISCIVHLVFFAALGLLAGNLPDRQPAGNYLVIDLTMVGGGGGSSGTQDLLPQPAAAAEPSPVRAAPVRSPVSAPLLQEARQVLPVAATDDLAFAGETGADQNQTGTAAAGGGTANTGGGAGSGSGPGSGGGNGTGSGHGDGSGVGPGTGAGSGPGIDKAIMAFLAEVEKRKEYPYIARKRGHEGVVTVLVELSAAGELNQVQVAKSSGSSQLDEAATAVIRRVSPFQHGLGRPVALKIPISYRLLP